MNTKENEIIKELSKKYDKKEKVIQIMYEKSKKVGYTIKEFKTLLTKFYRQKINDLLPTSEIFDNLSIIY